MSDDWFADLQSSSSASSHIVLPTAIKQCPEFGGGDYRMVEGSKTKDELRSDLDILAGIDAYQRWSSAMRGIALRVQYCKIPFDTFTIRISRPSGVATEYQKRLEAIKRKDEGFLYPFWTIQAYLTAPGGELLSIGIAKTEELYRFVEKRFDRLPRRSAGNGGQVFIYVDWDRYANAGNYCFIYPPRPKYPDDWDELYVEGEENFEPYIEEESFWMGMSKDELLDWVETMEMMQA